eukprot:11159619-Lingulodinium_polyedra.AAC.1
MTGPIRLLPAKSASSARAGASFCSWPRSSNREERFAAAILDSRYPVSCSTSLKLRHRGRG